MNIFKASEISPACVEDVKKWDAVDDAQQASVEEHNETFQESFKANKKAVFWSIIISLSIVMEGYDTGLMSQFFGYPTFQERYGKYYEGIGYQISGPWQAGLVNGSNVGVVIGGFLNGFFSARYGYRMVMLVSLFFMNFFIFITFFAPSIQVLLVGQIMCGLTWGVFATTGPAYASEVCPLALRGYLTVYVNLCWAMGQFISAGVLVGLLPRHDEWSYRIPFAIQWIWPLPLFIAILWAPESPWWYIRQDRYTDAQKTLSRLSNKTMDELKSTIAQMIHTIKIENDTQAGASYFDCFRGADLRRTEICCATFAGQMLSGAMFAYGPTYFFLQAGFSADNAYKLGLGNTAIAFVGTVSSWYLLSRFGRRTIYVSGIASLTIILLIVGIISVASKSHAAIWGQAGLCLLWLLVYSLTIGPIAYAIISETSAVRLRAKTVALSRNVYNITAIIAAVLEPYMMNPTEWNWKGKTAFFWCGSAFLTTIWAYYRLPECKNRTYEELDIMFARGVPARDFSTYEVDAYAPEQELHFNPNSPSEKVE